VPALKHAPYWWGQDKDAKHNAIFIIPPATVDQVFAEVGAKEAAGMFSAKIAFTP